MRVLAFETADGDEVYLLVRSDDHLMKTAHFVLFEREKAGYYKRAGKTWKERKDLCLAGAPSAESVSLVFERAKRPAEGVRLIEVQEV